MYKLNYVYPIFHQLLYYLITIHKAENDIHCLKNNIINDYYEKIRNFFILFQIVLLVLQ